ncbi:MAG: ABC transporter ATP-binding protein [bacterium]
MNALEVRNLSKGYKNSSFKLDNVSLVVPKGNIVGLVGKNGVGKSTIINSIFDIIKKDSGDIIFYGELLSNDNKHLKNQIGVVFDTLAYSGEIKIKKLEKVLVDLYKDFDVNLFNSYIKRFDLPVDKKLKTFSRGMTMQLSIAVAISHGAKLLILDEATAGLDPVKREEILDIFLEFIENEENSILMSSHITSDLEKVADYITFIDNGKIIFSDTKDNIIYNYGIARLKEAQFQQLKSSEYISARKRGLQTEVLVSDKALFSKEYPSFIIDNATLDEILPIVTKQTTKEGE